jgi:hypothetical protein
MRATATPDVGHIVLPPRVRYGQKMKCQIV